MKAYFSLLLLCCLFGFNNGQLTSSQIAGNWIDDSSTANGAQNAACCLPVATAAAPLIVTAGSTTSTMSLTGTWGSTTSCTNLGLKAQPIASTNQAFTSSASSNTFPVAFTYTYTPVSATLTGTTTATASANGAATLAYTMNSVQCTQTLATAQSATGFNKDTFANWGVQYYGTPNTQAGCCYPSLSNSASTDALTNIKGSYTGTTLTLTWTWDTTTPASLAACKLVGLSGTATAVIPAASFASSVATISAISTGTAVSNDVFSSATASTWTYITQGQSCAITLKKNTSSASHIALSFAGLLLIFVAYL